MLGALRPLGYALLGYLGPLPSIERHGGVAAGRTQLVADTVTPMSFRRLAAVALIALATGCGSNEKPAAVPPSASSPAVVEPSPSPPPSTPAKPKAKTYASAKKLAAAIEDCAAYEEVADPIGAKSLGNCYVGEDEIVVAIYTTQDDADGSPREKAAMLEGISDTVMVVGNKWTASCDTVASCKKVEATIGGDLVVISA